MIVDKRPESHTLDTQQITDLRAFMETQPRSNIEAYLAQLKTNAARDIGPYTNGGTPSNVTKALILMMELLDTD